MGLYNQPGIVPNFNHLHPSPTAPRLIGLSGYAGSGKDTVGDIINHYYGHVPVSFSDKLRQFLYRQNLYLPDGRRLNDVVDDLGWEEAREEDPYVRVLQQNTGHEGRGLLYDDVWLDAVMDGLPHGGRYVFTSVRYPNEALRIVENGGSIFRIERPGVEASNDHASDTALDDWEFEGFIYNNGTLLDLEGQVMIALGDL